MAETVLLAFAGLCAVAGSAYAVFSRKLFSAVLGFGTAMLFTGMVYLILEQSFLAMIHVIIYTGGVAVLALFAYITSISSEEVEEDKKPFSALALFAGILVSLSFFFVGISLSRGLEPSRYRSVSAFEAGSSLLKRWIFEFELISVLLLVSLVAALSMVSRRENS